MTRVVVDAAAVAALGSDPRVLEAVGDFAEQAVAVRMRDRARGVLGGSDAGPDSIHAEPAPDPADGFRVSWDPRHFYLSFAELGTEHEPARPFARPTADEFRR